MLTKFPFKAEVKTRLARDLGEAKAARLSWAFVQDTLLKLQDLREQVDIKIVLNNPPSFMKVYQYFEVIGQGEGNLGQRLFNISQALLKKYPWVLLIGSDAPHIPTKTYLDAIDHMKKGHHVLGPSADGGYYIQGLHACPKTFFDDVPWSHVDTCAAIKAKYEALSTRFLAILPEQFDIDHLKNLEQIKKNLSLVYTQKII